MCVCVCVCVFVLIFERERDMSAKINNLHLWSLKLETLNNDEKFSVRGDKPEKKKRGSG